LRVRHLTDGADQPARTPPGEPTLIPHSAGATCLMRPVAPRRDDARCRPIAMARGMRDLRRNLRPRRSHRACAQAPRILSSRTADRNGSLPRNRCRRRADMSETPLTPSRAHARKTRQCHRYCRCASGTRDNGTVRPSQGRQRNGHAVAHMRRSPF